MAKKWAEVVQSEGYQALPDNEKLAARDQYFATVVAPQVPPEDVELAKGQFYSYADSLKLPAQAAAAPPAAPAQVAAPAKPEATIRASDPRTPFEMAKAALGRVGGANTQAAAGILHQLGILDADQAAQSIARGEKQRQANPHAEEAQAGIEQIGRAKTYSGAAKALVMNPQATLALLEDSIIQTLPTLVSGVIGKAGGRAAGTFAGSGGLEYASALADTLNDMEVDLRDPAAVADALRNPEVMSRAKEVGAKRGLIVGAFDAMSMGLAGRFMNNAKRAVEAGGKASMAGAAGKEAALQVGAGSGGEFLAQQATGQHKPADVLLEGIAELPGGIAEVGAGMREGSKSRMKNTPAPAPTGAPATPPAAPPTAPAPAAAAPAPAGPAPSAAARLDDATRAQAIAEDIVRQYPGTPEDMALRMARKRVVEERAAIEKRQLAQDTSPAAQQVPHDEAKTRIDALAQEYVAAGLPPDVAVRKAAEDVALQEQYDAENEALAGEQQQAGGAPRGADVPDGNDGAATGAGVPVAGGPAAQPAAVGAGEPVAGGVVPAAPDAGRADGAAQQQHGALTPTPEPAKGMVRYYHGGHPTEPGIPLHFTSDLRDAEGWASRAPGMQLFYVDVPQDHPARGGDPLFGVLPPSRIEFEPGIADARKPLVPNNVSPAPVTQTAENASQPLQRDSATATQAGAKKKVTKTAGPMQQAVAELLEKDPDSGGTGQASAELLLATAQKYDVPVHALEGHYLEAADRLAEGLSEVENEIVRNPEQFGRSSALMALDQAAEYGGEQQAIDSLRDNVTDTLNELGVRDRDTFDRAYKAFDDAVAEARGEPVERGISSPIHSSSTGEQAPARVSGTENANSDLTAPTQEGAANQTAAPKAKRGRKPLPPEQKAEREAARKQGRAASMKADRAVKKAEAELNDIANLDEGEFDSDEALAEAREQQRATRQQALLNLIDIEKEHRGSAVGKRAKAALATHTNPKEIEDLKKGRELRNKRIAQLKDAIGPVHLQSPDAMGSIGRDKLEPSLADAANGPQVLTRILKVGNAFQKLLAQRLRNFVQGVEVTVLEEGDELPSGLAKHEDQWERSRALYVEDYKTGKRAVYVRGASFGVHSGLGINTLLHELLHAATNRKIALAVDAMKRGIASPAIAPVQALIRTMRRAQERLVELSEQGKLNDPYMLALLEEGGAFTDPREFVTYGLTDERFQNFLKDTKGVLKDGSFFTRFVNAIRELVGIPAGHANAFTDLVQITDKLMSTAEAKHRDPALGPNPDEALSAKKLTEEEKAANRADRKAKVALEKVRRSRRDNALGNLKLLHAARDPRAARAVLERMWKVANAKKRRVLVTLPTMDFLTKWAADAGVPRLRDAYDGIKKMLGMSQQFLVTASKLAEHTREQLSRDPVLKERLENLVYASTLANMDPSSQDAPATFKKEWADLGPEGQKLYNRLRDYYAHIADMYRDLLDQKVENLSGLSAESKANILSKIRQQFEQGDVIDPFFPLVRRGNYWLAIGTGKRRKFLMFESMVARDTAADALAKEQGKDLAELIEDRTFEIGDDLKKFRAATYETSTMLKEVFDSIDATVQKAGGDRAKLAEELKDSVYQLYLQTMPEQSFRKMFIHRKGTAGFSTDLARNINTSAIKTALQLSRLQYGDEIRNSLSAARDLIAERPHLNVFVEEMEKRVEKVLAPTPHTGVGDAVIGFFNKASFVWYLSSAATGLVQLSAPIISGLPVLGGNHNDRAGAAFELAKAFGQVWKFSMREDKIDGSRRFTPAPSLANSKWLTKDETRAIREMEARGVTQSTYTNLLFDYNQKDTDLADTKVAKAERVATTIVGGLMHTTERLTREGTFLAAYRLGRKNGMTHEEAVDQAVDDVDESMGNYDMSNRPRWMQGRTGRLTAQFRMYPIQMTLLLVRNFQTMLSGTKDKAERKAAATKFFGMMGTTFMLGGAFAVPGMSLAFKAVEAAMNAFGDEDDEEEFKTMNLQEWFRSVFLRDMLDTPWSELLARGPLNYATGWDIAGRVSLNDMWSRDSKEYAKPREEFIATALEYAGPSASMVLSWIDAYDAYRQGDYQRMAEKMMPAVFRNMLVAKRFEEEGVKDFQGSQIVEQEELTTGEKVGQAIGFRPDRVADKMRTNFALRGLEQKIQFERNHIMRRLNVADRKGDEDMFDEVLDEVLLFNSRFPSYAIKPDDLRRSLKTQAEIRGKSDRGVDQTNKKSLAIDGVFDAMERSSDEAGRAR